MKTSEKLRQYFGCPSDKLEPLLQEVEQLEADLAGLNADEDQQVGRLIRNLEEGWGVARGVDLFYLVEDVAGTYHQNGKRPIEVFYP